MMDRQGRPVRTVPFINKTEEVNMTTRWLKNIQDGEIYGWNEILAANPLTKEVTEEEAFQKSL